MSKKILSAFLLIAVFSCGFQVIYEDKKNESDISYIHELAAIKIKKNRTKLDQDLKNNLYDLFNPDYTKVEPKYFLTLTTTKTLSSTFTTQTGSVGRYRIALSVTYNLKSLETGDVISEGDTIVYDNYDVTTNRYATYVTDQYVQTNLTKVAAQNIRNSLVNDLIEAKRKSLDKNYKSAAEENKK